MIYRVAQRWFKGYLEIVRKQKTEEEKSDWQTYQ